MYDATDLIRYIHLFSLLISLILLIVIYIKYFKYYINQTPITHKVNGLKYIILAFFFWGLLASYNIYININSSSTDENIFPGLLSTINNTFFLLSIPFFTHGFKTLRKKKNYETWNIIVICVAILYIISILFLDQYQLALKHFDFAYSSITLIILSLVIFKSFNKRGYNTFGYVTIFLIILLILRSFIIIYEIETEFVKNHPWDEIIFGLSSFGIQNMVLILTFTWISEVSNGTIIGFLEAEILANHSDASSLSKISKEKLRLLIEEDKIELAIKSLLIANKDNQISNYNSISLLTLRHNRNEKEKIDGTITNEVYAINKQNISKDFLRLIS